MTAAAETADAFVAQLTALAGSEDDEALGAVPMRDVFSLAKASIGMPLDEIESLLESPIHKARVGAVSVMDFQARRKRTDPDRRRELFDLYLRRHDRIDSWDLVDRAAPHVVGGYLADKPRNVLYDLARSGSIWERRTAIVATYFFIRLGETEDTFAIAELLVDDDREMIQTAVGGWIREAGKRDPERLTAFLDRHAATMPRTGLRYAIKLLDEPRRAHYLSLAEAN